MEMRLMQILLEFMDINNKILILLTNIIFMKGEKHELY